ncbi:hypothetical protein VUR80DRAFT_7903 [Thermomyces stellatus]
MCKSPSTHSRTLSCCSPPCYPPSPAVSLVLIAERAYSPVSALTITPATTVLVNGKIRTFTGPRTDGLCASSTGRTTVICSVYLQARLAAWAAPLCGKSGTLSASYTSGSILDSYKGLEYDAFHLSPREASFFFSPPSGLPSPSIHPRNCNDGWRREHVIAPGLASLLWHGGGRSSYDDHCSPVAVSQAWLSPMWRGGSSRIVPALTPRYHVTAL